MMYDPVTDNFTTYKPVEPKEIKLNLPLFGEIDIPGAYRISSEGTPIYKPNTPKTQEYRNIFENIGEGHLENPLSTYSETSGNGPRTKQAIDFFISKGLTANQAKGIVGNLMHESGDPTLTNITNKGDKNSSFGMAQWHDTSSGEGRWTNLKNYAKSLGKSENDFDVQLNFLWKELEENPNWLTRLKATTTIEGATKQFMLDFEKPHKDYQALESRIKHAKSLV